MPTNRKRVQRERVEDILYDVVRELFVHFNSPHRAQDILDRIDKLQPKPKPKKQAQRRKGT